MATAWRPIWMAGLLVANGSRSGLAIQPTELTVSHRPTKCGWQLRDEKVALKARARSKYSSTRGSLLSASRSFSAASIIRVAYGTNASFKRPISP